MDSEPAGQISNKIYYFVVYLIGISIKYIKLKRIFGKYNIFRNLLKFFDIFLSFKIKFIDILLSISVSNFVLFLL